MSKGFFILMASVAGMTLGGGGPAKAEPAALVSQVANLTAVTLETLPENKWRDQGARPEHCFLAAENRVTVAGNLVAARGWSVTNEISRGDLSFVSFAGQVEPGTSGMCIYSHGNVGVFRGGQPLGVIYTADSAASSLTYIEELEGERLRLWGGKYGSWPMADLVIESEALMIVKPVAERDSFCDGATSLPTLHRLPFDVARRVLMSEGWEPSEASDQSASDSYQDERAAFPELDSCSGTRVGYCAFGYSKDDSYSLWVTTVGGSPSSDNLGQGSPVVQSYEIGC